MAPAHPGQSANGGKSEVRSTGARVRRAGSAGLHGSGPHRAVRSVRVLGLVTTLVALFGVACAPPEGPGSAAPSAASTVHGEEPPPRRPGPTEEPDTATVPRARVDARGTVVRVVDGDTLDILIEGEGVVRVRLIGVDAPESVDPSRPVECYGLAASRFVHRRLLGVRVGLEYDVERLDRYGRTLAYLWVGGRLFNEELVREGYAQVLTVPPNVKYVERFVTAQRQARTAGRGLWSACPEGGEATAASGPSDESSGSCDPSYPDVCIPPPPPDLDCADVPHRRFRVVLPDPHRFDGDGDGLGCEA
jgi:micrococcal nuclease